MIAAISYNFYLLQQNGVKRIFLPTSVNETIIQEYQVIFSKNWKISKICLEKSGSSMSYMENLTNSLPNLILIYQIFVKWGLKNLEYLGQIWKVVNAAIIIQFFHAFHEIWRFSRTTAISRMNTVLCPFLPTVQHCVRFVVSLLHDQS